MVATDGGQNDGESAEDDDEGNLEDDALSKESITLLENLGNMLTVVTKELFVVYVRKPSWFKELVAQVERGQYIRLTFITASFPDEVIKEGGIPAGAAHALESDCEFCLKAPRQFSNRREGITAKWLPNDEQKEIFILKVPFTTPEEEAPIRFTS